MAEKNESKEEISEDELDQIIQDMSKDDLVETAPKAPVLDLVQGKKQAEASPQALTLEMSGVVNLKLCFRSGERGIEVLCSEDALVCRLADGTEFRIPTGNGKARKAA